jgi:hypothetical protein
MDPSMPQVLLTVTAVLWQLSWRLRIWLIAATLVALVTSGQSAGTARLVAAGILVASAGLAWWTVRDLPSRTRPVVAAALRTDAPLRFTYIATTACVAVYAVIAVTGLGVLAGMVWLVLGLLGWLTLVVRIVRSRRSRR